MFKFTDVTASHVYKRYAFTLFIFYTSDACSNFVGRRCRVVFIVNCYLSFITEYVVVQASCLVVSEIVRRSNVHERAASIEKWAAIADICRCMHNFNGVLQICAAFVNSAIYRLRKTWEKIPKQARHDAVAGAD